MRLESDTMLVELLALKVQLVELRRYARALEASFGSGNVALAIEATTGAHRILNSLTVTSTRLRTYVVLLEAQQMGDYVESTGELALRATTLIIAEQLNRISDALLAETHPGGPARTANAPALFLGRFRGFDELAAFVRAELGRFNASWMRHASTHPRATSVEHDHGDGPRRSQYRRAVRDAQRALAGIGDDPDVAQFLRTGREALSPEIRVSCSQIVVALQLRLDTELDPAMLEGPLARASVRSRPARSRRQR